MAELYPALQDVQSQEPKPRTSEIHILEYLEGHLNDEYEVYYKPSFNGDVIDVVVLKAGSGVAVIKVVDMSLGQYELDGIDRWIEVATSKSILAPNRQVNGYKQNLFNLHISGLAEKAALNEYFRKTIHPYVFVYGAEKEDLVSLYESYDNSAKLEMSSLNEKRKRNEISHDEYERLYNSIDQRKKRSSFAQTTFLFEGDLGKIGRDLERRHVLFVDEIYDAFREYLRPEFHSKEDGCGLEFSGIQRRLVKSAPGQAKIKGVAGCGKTTMLAARAVNATRRHGGRVLILTYNKTLRNLIRHRVNDVDEDFSSDQIVINNFHSFINMNLNHSGRGKPVPPDDKNASAYFDAFYKDESMFDGFEEFLYKYETILLDEVQDYEPEWVKIILKYFLSENGEMVLYGDEGQNIYERDLKGPKSYIVKGFGTWQRLRRSLRSKPNSPLTQLVKEFQEEFLLPKYDIDIIESRQPSTISMNYDLLQVSAFDSEKPNSQAICDKAKYLIDTTSVEAGDITIIGTDTPFLRGLEKQIVDTLGIKTITTFETEENYLALKKICEKKGDTRESRKEFYRKVEAIQDSKKFAFDPESPLMKISTVHSFKGMDSDTVIYVVMPDDNAEMVYTGITRARTNLLLFLPKKSEFRGYFEGKCDVTYYGDDMEIDDSELFF